MNASPEADPSTIGRAIPAPFVRLPEPGRLFALRAARFRQLAPDHPLGPYLLFMGDLAQAQHDIQPGLPDTAAPDGARIEQAQAHGMPIVDRAGLVADATVGATLDALFDAASAIEMPAEARVALVRVSGADDEALRLAVSDVLADAIPVESLAGHAFVAAALQVHAARLAAGLSARDPRHVAPGACPVCGGPPVSSLVVGWPEAENSRYCICSLCATAWNHVRVKCTICESTSGIGYREIDGGDGSVKAECCDTCGNYVKIFDQRCNHLLDPVADDVGSLGLDLLLKESPWRRAAFNPYLLGV